MKITMNQFGGTFPKVSPRLLDSKSATSAVDTKLWSGELRPFYTDVKELTLDSAKNTIYRYSRPDGSSQWLTWTSENLSFVQNVSANDQYNRVYVSGFSDLRCFDSTLVGSSDTTVLENTAVKVAVEKPTTRASMSVSGTGTGAVESRSYVYAYVRKWQDSKVDLGVPSDPAYKSATTTVVVDVQPGQTVTVTGIAKPLAQAASAITHIRLYRSAVTSTGDASYRYVCEWPLTGDLPTNVTLDGGTNTYTVTDALPVTSLGETIESMSWSAPESGLSGLVSLKNGILVAFKGNDVFFSEPYQPHAWPQDYRVTVDSTIVGLGCFGNTVVVCTKSSPILMTVSDPASVLATPVQESLPCVSAKSICSLNGGVIYASTQGLVLLDSTKPRIITQDALTGDEWEVLNPSTIRGNYYRGQYFAFCSTTSSGANGFVLDVFSSSTGIIELSQSCTSSYVDPERDELYLVYKDRNREFGLYKFDGGTSELRTYFWKSKEFVSNTGYASFAAARVEFADDAYVEPSPTVFGDDSNNSINYNIHNIYSINGGKYTNEYNMQRLTTYTTFRYYVDGTLRYTKLVKDGKPFRLPSGFVGSSFSIDITSTKSICRIQLATSMGELE